MALPRSFPAGDAEASLRRTGKYTFEDRVVGSRIKEFWTAGFPTKSPLGLEFIAQNSFIREDLRRVLVSMLGHPRLGLIKVYSNALPSEYAFRFHGGSNHEAVCLLLWLWSPGSKVCLYEGSTSWSTENDSEVAKTWGLLASPKPDINEDDAIVNLQDGGLILQDSRLLFSLVAGTALMIGFGTEEEVKEWGKIELPDSDALKAKVNRLEMQGEGIHINCFFKES